MKSSSLGLIAWAGGAAVSAVTVWGGYGLLRSQLSNPLLRGFLMPASVAGALLTIFTLAVLAVVTLVGVVTKLGEPRLLDRVTYSLVGHGGIVGALGAAVYVGHELFQPGALGLRGEAVAAILLVAIPTLHAANWLRVPEEPVQTSPVQGRIDSASKKSPTNRRNNSETATEGQDTMDTTTQKRTQDASPEQTTLPIDSLDIDDDNLEFSWVVGSGIDFDDVGGMEDLKHKLKRDIVKPLTTHKAKANRLGITVPNLIFHGPPGTGKTYLAEALATEIGVPFTKVTGSDLKSRWINESADRVRMLLEESQWVAEKAGGAVVFIDEIDGILTDRNITNHHEEDRKVTNEFLSAVEDVDDADILIIGATNRLEAIDKAAIRNGRFDRKIEIEKPSQEARQAILAAQIAQRSHNISSAHFERIAENTDGLTPAALESLVEDAARRALVKRNDDQISPEDMYQVLEERHDANTQRSKPDQNHPGIF